MIPGSNTFDLDIITSLTEEGKHKMTEKEFEKEIELRIAQVEDGIPEIKKMKKKDYVQVGIVVFICLIGMIAGAFL